MKQNYNNESLARLGHGKWKSVLGHTLLIIGMVLMSLGVYAQTPSTDIPAGLKMKKTWVADDPLTNTSGKVVLETYVTGSEITTTSSVPNDIVIIVDQSGSMDFDYGSGNRLDALKDAVETFCTKVKNDAVQNQVDHKIAIVGFASGYTGYNSRSGSSYWGYTYSQQRWNWTNTELLSTQNEVAYGAATSGACAITTQNYQDALVSVNVNGNVNNRLTTAITRMASSGGTCMQYGLEMAYGVLSNRRVTTYQAPDGTTHPRGQIVIFFTDGYPGMFFPTNNNYNAPTGQDGRFAQGYGDNDYFDFGNGNTPRYVYYNELWSAANIADAAVAQANNLKSNGATIFAVGIFDGATPTAAYQTNPYNGSYDGNTYHYWQTSQSGINGDPAANGLMHMISSNYDNKPGCIVGMASNWQDETTNTNNSANRFVEHTYTVDGEQKTWTPKYFAAGNPDDLNAVFSSIADQSGAEPMEMSAATVVQDEVSASFTLPEGASINDIEIYAVKCSGGVVNQQLEATDYYFQTTGGDEFGTKTTYADDGTTIQYLTLNANGVVVEGNNLPENRLDPKGPDGIANTDDDIVQIINNQNESQKISLTGFNFANMFCGPIIVNHQVTGWEGRKLVIKIPIEVADGVWGDGIATNGPMSFVLPDGGTVSYAFECPITNVLGDVWTEIVTEEPENFDPNNIDSPEDLAWFISVVNGRQGYENDTEDLEPTNDQNGTLTADIDMSAHNWVPIGSSNFKHSDGTVTHNTYSGTFNGNGHVITGLKNNASKFYKQIIADPEHITEDDQLGTVVFPGMFSDVSGTVMNVFVLDADFRGKNKQPIDANGRFVHHGIIVDTLEAGGEIFNCEAAGRITCNNDDPTNDQNLIYGGLVGLIREDATVHSCMAMAELTGYTMGGMVGENRGSFSNGFTNGVYNYIDNSGTGKYAGGIAGINKGTINNCYVRFERYNTNLDKMGDGFGMLYGSNTGTNNVTNCYTPELYTYTRPSATQAPVQVQTNSTVPNQGAMNPYTITVSPTYFNYFTNDNMTKGSWPTTGNPIYQNGKSLLAELNANKGSGASWKRTTAGNYDYAHGSGDINDDYPVLAFEKFAEGDDAPLVNCLGSADGIRIDYATSLDEMLERHNNYTVNKNSTWNNDKYKNTKVNAIKGGAINLYQNDDNVTKSTMTATSKDGETVSTVVYIDENISLLQDESSNIEAYTGQTVKSFVKSNSKERWHYVSSSLANSQFGWTYSGDGQHNWNENPCGFTLAQTDEDRALFPIDLISYKRVDFYCFYEPQYHWINFKRNSNSHFHMDQWNAGIPIQYDNETAFEKGKGYLLAIESDYYYNYGQRNAQFLQNRGTLNNGEFTIPVTYTPINDLDGYKTGLEGCNLLGNPYQSYLDFDAFTTVNSGLWSEGDTYGKTYAIYDPKTDNYIEYIGGSSNGALVADRFINMHQGFLIKVSTDDVDATFSNDMRTNNPGEDYPGFRGEKPAYPLINFILNDNDGNTDIAVLECNRPENDGAKKLRVGNPAGRIYFRYDNENLAIYFRNSDKDYQTLNFAAEEDGNFTLSWNTANADFRTLTLVDNITGIKTDMLTHDHYTFEGRVDDYNTRFKIVFGEMNNNEEEPVLEHFAFFDHGNLIVNGTGHFEVVDVLGRVVYATELTDTQNTVSLPSNVRGVCMLCFTRNNETKVQKMVIQ